MSKALKKLIDINRLREFKNKLVGTDSAYVQTGAVDQTVGGTKTFSKPIVGSVTGSSGSCTGNAATATRADSAANADTATNANYANSAGIAPSSDSVKGRGWLPNGVDMTTLTSGSYQCSPNNLPSQGVPYGTSTYGELLIACGSQYTSIIYIDVFGSSACWSSNQQAWVINVHSGNIGSQSVNYANSAAKATQDSDGNQINTTYSKNGHTHDDRYYTEAEVNNLLAGKANTSHTHPYIPTSASCNKNWNWSGRGGQPSWLWGGEDGTNMYVYNPSDFRVNYANSANSAVTADHATSVRTSDNQHTISFDWASQVPGRVGLKVDGTNMGGIVATWDPAYSLARVGTYDIGSTIHARTDSQEEYGAKVAGSQLKYAAMDSRDGNYDPNRQLTTVGTWLKVSGDSGNTDGSGLYRRIA